MKILAVIGKNVRQALRDRLGLALTILTAPFFVVLYGSFFAGEVSPLPGAPRPFDAYVPGLVVFSVIMLVFSAAMSVAREVEYGAILRLKLTPLTAIELLGGMSLVQLVIGAASLALTFTAAHWMGFRSQGQVPAALLLGTTGCLASIGVGMLVASLARTTTRAFLISSLVMFLLVLFSGVIFPRPAAKLGAIGGREVGVFDSLPTTQLAVGLEKLFRRGEHLSDLGFELGALLFLSIAYFAIGVTAFQRRHGLARGTQR